MEIEFTEVGFISDDFVKHMYLSIMSYMSMTMISVPTFSMLNKICGILVKITPDSNSYFSKQYFGQQCYYLINVMQSSNPTPIPTIGSNRCDICFA